MKKSDKLRLMGAITGAAIMAGATIGEAAPIEEDIICKVPEFREYQLKLHSCATLQYPLTPLVPQNIEPEPEPIPPYTS